ncbi:MAG: type II secretion system minor pseudopilin GspJ [Gammaproteobacteria bacterium]
MKIFRRRLLLANHHARQLSHAAGFTLLELLVALSIFAVLAAMSYGGLRSVLDTRERTERQAAQLAELQFAFSILQRDIEQTLTRKIRDNFGEVREPLVAEQEGEQLVEFTRTGWRNPAGQVRSNLQRVAYAVIDEQLVRSSWNVLDRAQNSEPQVSVLMQGVKGAALQFIDKDFNAQDHWPMFSRNTSQQQVLPTAIEVTLDVAGWGRMTRLFRIVDGPQLQIIPRI